MWIYFAFMFFVYCSYYVYTKDFYQVLIVTDNFFDVAK